LPRGVRSAYVDEAHRALLNEIRRRLDAAADDPNVKNSNGSNYWGPYVTRAVNKREGDGSGLVQYIQNVLRKSADSEGWNALLEARRLDISFEDMVANADEPIRSLFTDEDRSIAERSLRVQQSEIERRREEHETEAVARDRRIVAIMAAKRRAQGKPWTAEMEAKTLADEAAKRRDAE
jgi:hypothetical protein